MMNALIAKARDLLTGLQTQWCESKNELFPCKECLVKPTCTKACERIIMDNNKLKEVSFEYKCCPDCGSTEFSEGPSGGLCTNIKCCSCGHWFNISPFTFERIHFNKETGVFEK